MNVKKILKRLLDNNEKNGSAVGAAIFDAMIAENERYADPSSHLQDQAPDIALAPFRIFKKEY